MAVQTAVINAWNRLHNVWAVSRLLDVSVPTVLYYIGAISQEKYREFSK